MAAPLQPTIRVTLNLAKVPASEGTIVYRWSSKPLADAAAFAEGRILKIGDIERALSTFSGDWDIAKVSLELDDPDGLFRGIASGVTTRYIANRELLFEVLSEAGRAASLDWRSLFRGRISSLQTPPGHNASIKCSDELGSRFSGFDLEKKLGVPITRNEHPLMPEANINRIYPIVIGEHSDAGAEDENGNDAEKGMLPVIDVGTVFIVDDSDVIPPVDTPIVTLAVPVPIAVVNGTAGVTSYVYGVTAISPYGETTAGIVTVTTGNATLTPTNSVTLSWPAVPGAIAYRVYGRDAEVPVNRLVLLNNNGAFVNPETTWEDEGDAVEETVCGPPSTNQANVDQVLPLPGEPVAYPWGRLITKIGANPEVFQVYASNLAASPKRARLPETAYGTECLVYGRPGWPHDDPYVEINGIRMGCIYMRGPRYEAHKSGSITITWNGCGDEDDGDGSGDTIDEAFPVLQHVLNEYVLKDGGRGYRTGDYGPLEEYADGVSKLKTSAFAACQAITVEWIGGRGYISAFAIVESISLRTFIQRFFVTFACLGGTDHFGRVYPVLIDDTADPLVGRMYRHRLEIEGDLVSQEFDDAAVETRAVYNFDQDTEARTFRVRDQIIEDQLATAAYTPGAAIGEGVPIEKGPRDLYYTRDRATAADATARHLMRVKAPPRYVAWKTDLTGLEDENGAQVRVTHPDGAGSATGDDATPFLVVKHRVLPNSPKRVVLTGFDLDRILSTNFGDLQDESTMSGNLYSDQVFAPPTAGAYEVR